MKKLIIFDLDGTIEDSRLDMSLSVNRIRKIYNLPELPIDAIKMLVNKGMDFLYRNCFPELIIDNKIPQNLINKYEWDYSEHIVDNTRIYENIDKVIENLSRKNILFIYTNKPEKLSKLLLQKLNLLQYFTKIIGGDSHIKSKPSIEPIWDAINELQLEIEEIFTIGDSEADIKTGKNLNGKTIWCKWGYSILTPETAPDYIVKEPLEILEIIQ